MKKLKNNSLMIIVFIFLVGFIIYGIYEYDMSYSFMTQNYYSIKNKCEQQIIESNNRYSFCEDFDKEQPPVKLDALNLSFYVINYTSFSLLLPFIPLLIIAMGIRKLYKEMKSGIFRNIILIKGYHYYIIQSVKQVVKYSLFIPVIIIIIFILSLLYTKSLDYTSSLNLNMNYMDAKYFHNIELFLSNYLIVLILNAIFWLNLGLIVLKKSRNYVISIVFSYILYLGYSIIAEILSGFIFPNIPILNSINLYNYMKPGNIWGYDGINSLMSMLFYSIILVLISSVVVFFKYRKKESVIIANEV